jgi:hypothetical protein
MNLNNREYINDPGHEVPDNKILIIPFPSETEQDTLYTEIIKPLKGEIKRDWFNSHFYYCLPLNIGNQYGFLVTSHYDFDATWNGKMGESGDITIDIKNYNNHRVQIIESGFGNGILTIQNHFHLKTPPGINLMTIQPPNMFVPGTVAMTAVIETDQLRRDFTFNLKFTDPGRKISFKKGDPLGAFIPIPRYFVDNFQIEPASKYFDKDIITNEHLDGNELGRQRSHEDLEKPHMAGRKYFNGEHAFGEKYSDHQKKIK